MPSKEKNKCPFVPRTKKMFGSFRNVIVSENEYKGTQHPVGGRSGWMRISTAYYCIIRALFSEVDFIYRFIERVPYFILELLSYIIVVCVSQFVIHVFHSDSIGPTWNVAGNDRLRRPVGLLLKNSDHRRRLQHYRHNRGCDNQFWIN